MIKRPMLAVESPDLESIRYPKMLSKKIDGIRCLKVNGRALSRRFKPIPNDFVRAWIEAHAPEGADGEIIVFDKTFNEIQSLVMSKDGEPDFEYHLFDLVNESTRHLPFQERYEALKGSVVYRVSEQAERRLQLVPHMIVGTPSEVRLYEESYVSVGFEGVMLRDPAGPYKEGRSTAREEYLLKVKRWQDAEGEVVGFEEQMRNENEAEVNELGLTKRSTSRDGMVPADTLGKLILRDVATGAIITVGTGTGLTKSMRQEIWDNQSRYLGMLATYKHQPSGAKDSPRFSILKGFRHRDDT